MGEGSYTGHRLLPATLLARRFRPTPNFGRGVEVTSAAREWRFDLAFKAGEMSIPVAIGVGYRKTVLKYG